MEPASWYTFEDKGKTVEISIHDEIGFGEGSARAFMESFKGLKKGQPVSLSIHSPGGSVLDGWAIYNVIKAHEGPVTGRVVGFAGSMASVILCACDTVEQPENAFQMIHNPTAGAWGESTDLANMAETLVKIQAGIVRAYAKRTGLSEDEIQELMNATTYMDGSEAVSKGFASVMLEPVKAAALSEDWKAKLPNNNFPAGLVFGSTSAPTESPQEPEPEQKPEPTPTPTNHTPEPPMSEPQPAPDKAPEAPNIKDILAQDKPRREGIEAIADRFKVDDKEVKAAIDNGVGLDEFRNQVIENFNPEAFGAAVAQKGGDSTYIGSPEAKNFSILKAVSEYAKSGGNMTGLEKEVQEELTSRFRNSTGESPKGILIPGEVSHGDPGGIRNASTVGTGTSGGNTVATEMRSLIEYFEDYSLLPKLGATVFRDATGNLSFPRVTAGYSGTWDAETDTIANADATFAANLVLSPKRVGAGTAVSLQLLAQSSIDFESWIRRRLGADIAIAIDRGAFTGPGTGDTMTGVLAASGTGSKTWAVGDSCHKNTVDQWKELRDNKLPMMSRAKWLSEPGVTADWMTTPKVSGNDTFVINEAPSGAQRALGFEYYDHTDITANKVVLADFSYLMVAMWGGIDLVVDPYSSKNAGQVELFANAFADTGLEQPSAFIIGDNGTTHA
jgi:HK97 family phage major capsid protein